MKAITIELTPEEAHNLLVMFDLALKHPEGGIKIIKACGVIVDKVNSASLHLKSSPEGGE